MRKLKAFYIDSHFPSGYNIKRKKITKFSLPPSKKQED